MTETNGFMMLMMGIEIMLINNEHQINYGAQIINNLLLDLWHGFDKFTFSTLFCGIFVKDRGATCVHFHNVIRMLSFYFCYI